ncbi:MAG: hypothetical protein M3521_11465 [Acidobacteriota bacterium]|jgi:F420-dependent methylenetetrahydromethanopterin dehydrogenase|nr:hypothetical protein [Acidobacteriota bacterium]
MNKNKIIKARGLVFTGNLPDGLNIPIDAFKQRMLKEYGAMFVAKGGAVPPNKIVFKDEAEVSAFQSKVVKAKENIGGFELELQASPMKKLIAAISEAKQNNLTITPRGVDSAKRSYAETVELWASRVNPGLTHWVETGKLSETEAAEIRALSPFKQVPKIFELELEGMFFSKDLSKTIVYSVAPPGTSQHLSMLAFDACEHENPEVREILARYGWLQTVVSDLPHFTYLGVAENELSGLGLKKVNAGGRIFWLPDL